MTTTERIVSNVKYLCKKNNISIGWVEKEVGVSAGYLSRMKGRKMLPIDSAYKIAEVLGIEMQDLISPSLAKQARIAELEAELAELKQEATDGTTD